MKKIESVIEYLDCFEGKVLIDLEMLRNKVAELVPEAVESLSYGLIAYKYKGKPLIYFGGFKKHIGIYATPQGHEAFKDELSKYKQGKGSVQFPTNEAIPYELVGRIIKFRKESLDA